MTVPADTPLTRPEPVPTEAIAELLLLHVAVPDGSLTVVAPPTQMVVGPVIADGNGLTVTGWVAIQPVGKVYVIVAMPALTPATEPDVPTVATAVLLLVHAPPVVPFVNPVVEPTQTTGVPPIVAGRGLTVRITDTAQPVGIV